MWLLRESHFLAAVLIREGGALQIQISALPLQSLANYSAARGVRGVGAFLE